MPVTANLPGGQLPIAAAIEKRRLLAFTYHGLERVVEPHIYGVRPDGRPALSAYQVLGGSASGEQAGWKLFHVHEMQDVRLMQRGFSRPRQGYNPDDGMFSRTFVKLESR